MGEDKDSVWNIPFLRNVLNSKLHHQMSSWTFTHFLVERNLLRGPAAAISMTSIRLSPWHRPSMRTMKGLLSWCMISASLIISSFTSFSFSLFSTLTATSTWPLWPDKKKKAQEQISVRLQNFKPAFHFSWRLNLTILLSRLPSWRSQSCQSRARPRPSAADPYWC